MAKLGIIWLNGSKDFMERNHNTIAVTGLSGVGKDFLIEHAIFDKNNTQIYSTNRILAELLKKNNIDAKTLTSEENIDDIEREANTLILDSINNAQNKHHILNTHITHVRGDGMYIDDKTIEFLKPRDIVLVKADPDTIIKRRQNDSSRNRISRTVDEIEAQQTLEESYASQISKKIGSRVVKLINEDQNTEENISELKSILRTSLRKDEYQDKIFSKQDLVAKIIENPNSRIDMTKYIFNRPTPNEEKLLGLIPRNLSEINQANIIYQMICNRTSYSQDFYLNFQNIPKLRDSYNLIMSDKTSDLNENINFMICQGIAIRLAELLKYKLNKTGFIENQENFNDGNIHIPHTTYSIKLLNDDNKCHEIVFDPINDFFSSDLLACKLNLPINILDSIEKRTQTMRNFYNRITDTIKNSTELITTINKKLLFYNLHSIERSSFISGLIQSYGDKTNSLIPCDRFLLTNNLQEELISIFKLDGHFYMNKQNTIMDLDLNILQKLEKSGILTCVSRKRHVFFS